MKPTLLRTARTGAVLFVTAMGVIVGNPLAGPILGFTALILYRLVDYAAREVERALDAASADRVAQLTWEIRTAAAAQDLQRARRRAAFEKARGAGLVHVRAYDPAPRWPSGDPDDFVAQLDTMLIPRVVPVPPEPEPVLYRGPQVDEFLFADGGLLCVPAALQLYRYADAP